MNNASKAPRTTVATSNDKCTIYYCGGLGNVVSMKVKRCEVKTGKWAQYDSALFVAYRAPRKQKDQGFVQADRQNLLVVEGWDAPKPASMFKAPAVSGSGLSVRESRHALGGAEWQGDFDSMINAHIESGAVKVVFDGRGHNPHQRTYGIAR